MNLATKDQTLEFHSVTDAIAQMFCQTYAPGRNVKVIYTQLWDNKYG